MIKFNRKSGLWEVWCNGQVIKTAFTRLYAAAIAAESHPYRSSPIYKMALAVGDPEPWPDEIPFNGEPGYDGDPLADDYALESGG